MEILFLTVTEPTRSAGGDFRSGDSGGRRTAPRISLRKGSASFLLPANSGARPGCGEDTGLKQCVYGIHRTCAAEASSGKTNHAVNALRAQDREIPRSHDLVRSG